MTFDPREAWRAGKVWIVALLGVLFVMASLAVFLASSALPHGAASWIQDGGYKNSVGELCCGERDCAELPSSDIQITAGGYLIKSLGETVPFAEAAPSPTGTYWRCYWGGKRKCFFAPPPNS